MLAMAGTASADGGEVRGDILDFDGDTTEWLETEADTPTGTKYLLYEHYGGFWADAEKDPNPGDDLLCWAAAGANMMEWTGWGFVGSLDDTDDSFQFFRGHVTDDGHFVEDGIDWWFDGTLKDVGGANETVDHTGFWPGYTPGTYIWKSWDVPNTLPNIRGQLASGRAVGISIYGLTSGAHAVTCWGFNYNPAKDPNTEADEYYLGVWLSDSDSHKGQWNPPDMLRYYAVQYDDTNDWWWMPNYGSGWKIKGVASLQPFPGESRPTASDGGAYSGDEGSAISFDASGSSDPDADPLEYRWDFDGDGTWDTAWSSSATASHTWNDNYGGDVYLEVFDNRLRDIDITTVTVNNVAPTANAGPDQTVDEGETVNFSGSASDPGADTLTYEWDFDDGDTASGTLTPTHVYCDDGTYTVTLTVTDDDGGVGTDTMVVTVNNVPPVANAGPDQTVDENVTVDFAGSASDVGSCDTLSYEWAFGDSGTASGTLTPSHTYGDNGVYTVTLTVTDDDGASDADTMDVTVNNVAPTVTTGMEQPNSQFILPVVHTLDFEANGTDPGSDDLTFDWDWGDTSSATAIYYNDGVGPDPYPSPDVNPMDVTDSQSHAYSTPGTYTVTLTVTDDDGTTNVTTMEVVVVTLEEAKHITNDYIQSLPDAAFKDKADKRKAAVDNMIGALDDMLDDQEYQGMIQALQKNLRQKADGLVDGKISGDWIVDAAVQQEICHKVDDMVAYISYLMTL
jgi:PKD repeat protein